MGAWIPLARWSYDDEKTPGSHTNTGTAMLPAHIQQLSCGRRGKRLLTSDRTPLNCGCRSLAQGCDECLSFILVLRKQHRKRPEKQWLHIDRKTIKTDTTLNRSGKSRQDGSNLFNELSKYIKLH